MLIPKLWGFLGLNFFIGNSLLVFPNVLNLGGQP